MKEITPYCIAPVVFYSGQTLRKASRPPPPFSWTWMGGTWMAGRSPLSSATRRGLSGVFACKVCGGVCIIPDATHGYSPPLIAFGLSKELLTSLAKVIIPCEGNGVFCCRPIKSMGAQAGIPAITSLA